MSRAAFYKWRVSKPSKTAIKQQIIIQEIKRIHALPRQDDFGSPRIYRKLQNTAARCCENTVAKLMRRERLSARRHRKFRIQTTDSKHELPIAPNRLKQNFTIQKLNQVWLTDFTYIPTREGFTYLCTVQDLCSRKIVGWTAGRSITAQLALDALNQAIALRNPEPGLIVHSDRGAQYASLLFRQRLKQRQFQQSMSRKGNCYDNAPMESFFKSYKCEEVSRQTYDTHEQVIRHATDYIEHFYNRNRPHSSIEYQAPIDFENNIRQSCINV